MTTSPQPAATETLHVGFDIGGTKCAVLLGCGSADGQPPRILAKEVLPTRDNPSPGAMLKRLVQSARALTGQARPEAGGISCGGPLDSRRGRVLSPPNLPGWDDVPIVEILQESLGIPVRLQNDANACALAEWRWGAARGADTVVFLTFGTGMGAGLIIGGRLHEGRDDLAGEIGHWRMADDGPEGFGKRGSFEGFCSGGGMARLARQKVRAAWAKGETVACCRDEAALDDLNVHGLSHAARAGDPLALAVFASAARQLGFALALLVDLLNPEVVVIGSIFGRCEDLLRPAMEATLAAQALPTSRRRCRVLPAGLGEHIGDYASLAVALTAR